MAVPAVAGWVVLHPAVVLVAVTALVVGLFLFLVGER